MSKAVSIRLDGVGKRYRYEWVFRNVDFHFNAGQGYALLGPNGSGKSSLMRVLTGSTPPSKGSIFFEIDGQPIAEEEVYKCISWAAPYMELIEEFTFEEMIDFQAAMKPFKQGFDKKSIIEICELEKAAKKQIRYYSSGMKQRVKLALALFADTPVLFLDEPTTNLDIQATAWYKQQILEHKNGRLIFIASNQPDEYEGICEQVFHVLDFK